MAYATVADMIARYGEEPMIQLTDRTGDGVIDAAVLEQKLADASALVDGYLAGRYPVPLSPVPGILVGYACDIARYNLYPDAELTQEHPVRLRYKDAIQFLTLVGQGRLNLGAAPEPASQNTVEMVTTDRRRHGIGL
jgi:phage gp36-like protein